MISLVLVLPALQAPEVPQAIALANKALSAPALVMEYTVSNSGTPSTGKSFLVIDKNGRQWFTCNWNGESVEFRQSNERAVIIRHDWKAYEEISAPRTPTAPPDRFVGVARVAIPPFSYLRSLTELGGQAAWKPKGTERIKNVECAVVTVEVPGQPTSTLHTAWIDPTGRINRWTMESSGMRVLFEFAPVDADALIAKAHFETDLPIGYVPARLAPPFYRTLRVDDPAAFGTWMDARTNRLVDLKRLAKGENVTLVFTDPESEICQTIEPFLAKLRKQLKARKCALVEVVLGDKAPDLKKADKDRQIYWDKDGAIEATYGPPGTPYFLMVDSTGLIVRGWQGYRAADEKKIVENFVSAFDRR